MSSPQALRRAKALSTTSCLIAHAHSITKHYAQQWAPQRTCRGPSGVPRIARIAGSSGTRTSTLAWTSSVGIVIEEVGASRGVEGTVGPSTGDGRELQEEKNIERHN
jgi:hypothetical protein